ncbi:hypothetical protein BJY52DRAFT_1415306 [Lactarius psammicola]|nr:hypothetical protein BJY52DRAFT_1415306 [Lactarius psammicola]
MWSPDRFWKSTLFGRSAILAKEDLHDEGSVDPVCQAKACILSHSLQEIGIGKYQRVTTRFVLLLAETASGRWPFNRLSESYFGIAMGGSLTFVSFASLAAISSISYPVLTSIYSRSCPFGGLSDCCSALCPSSSSYVTWLLITNFSSVQLAHPRAQITHAAIFPRTLACTPDAEAVVVVREIARYNGAETALTARDLEEAARGAEEKQSTHKWRVLSEGSPWMGTTCPIAICHEDGPVHPPDLDLGWSVGLPYVRDNTGHLLYRQVRLTGAVLFASTTAHSLPALFVRNYGHTLFSNVNVPDSAQATPFLLPIYGKPVNHVQRAAVTPEVIPADHRSRGNGLTGTAAHIFSVLAPSIAYMPTLIPRYLYTSLADSSLFQAALHYCYRSSPTGKHPSNSNYDLVSSSSGETGK